MLVNIALLILASIGAIIAILSAGEVLVLLAATTFTAVTWWFVMTDLSLLLPALLVGVGLGLFAIARVLVVGPSDPICPIPSQPDSIRGQ